jgi:hypothetical protein
METSEIQFEGKSFCFTGKLADLKRTQAEQEARARGALTVKVVNERLDYLVIGSIPAAGWKFGNYGRKIERAQDLIGDDSCHLTLLSEDDYLEALAKAPCTNSGEIDAKVAVVNYKFMTSEGSWFDEDSMEVWLGSLNTELDCQVVIKSYPASSFSDLFGEVDGELSEKDWVIFCRIVKQFPIEEEIQPFVDSVENGFARINGVDGDSSWFERKEGSGDYLRLIREIPNRLRIPGL